MHVEVVAYRPDWEAAYRKEAQAIRRILGDELVEIHHIGSTAVPGLAAKPIIDILPVVTSLPAVDNLNQAFIALGYEPMGEFGIPGRRYFRKGGSRRTHQVHIFEQSNLTDITRHLALRDYLRAHPATARQYGELKHRLAERFSDDIAAYCDGKDAFVKQLEQLALSWWPGHDSTD